MLKNFLVGKGSLEAIKASVSSSFAPAPSGIALVFAPAFSSGTGLNRLYALVSR